jgi:Ca2+-dependent lipid-binding protein
MDSAGQSDPYVKVGLAGGASPFKTTVQNGTNNPTWEQDFNFEVLSYSTDILELKMYDKDLVRDDKMGRLFIQVCQLPPGQIIDDWYALKPVRGCSTPGEIHIGLQIAIKGTPPWQIAPFIPLQVDFTLVEAKDLAKMDTIGKSDPYCIIKLKHTPLTYTSKVKDNTLTPVWNETITFPLTNPYVDTITVLMRDKDLAVDDDMATLDIALAPYVSGQPADVWSDMIPVKGVKKGGQIRYKVAISAANRITYAPVQPGVVAEGKQKKGK